MEFPTHRLPLKDPTGWNYLYFLSDVHLGAAGCNIKKFREKVQEIADNERAYWFGIGDIGDFIYYNDPRFKTSGFLVSIIDEIRKAGTRNQAIEILKD
jgi:hypothetical protein